MMAERRPRIGVNKEDEIEMGEKDKKEMEMLQFFVDRNGKSTHADRRLIE